jgi:transposase InsO family protein
MRLHANAALSLKGRERMVLSVLEGGRAVTEAAMAAGVSARTCSKWVARYRAQGSAGLLDRSSAPRTVANRTDPGVEQLLGALRRLRFTSPELSELLGMPLSTVCAVLKRLGMGKLGRLGLQPAVRYERQRPGELIHIDVKKLGRIRGGAGKRVTGGITRNGRPQVTDPAGVRRQVTGWDAVHIAIDDATRLAYAEVLGDEKAMTAVAFLGRAIEFFARHGIHCQQIITDNGSPYRSASHAIACRALGVRHRRTRPYRPQTNGKAERFIRTILSGWAYGPIYASSHQRTQTLDGWPYHYNHRRPHQALGRQTPITRLNNLLGTYT